jgi:hypothetical protein
MAMDSPASDSDQRPLDRRVDVWPVREEVMSGRELELVGEIAGRLGRDPAELWVALESLETLEPESRLAVVNALSKHDDLPAVQTLLRLLSTGREPAIRTAAEAALSHTADRPDDCRTDAECSVPAVVAFDRSGGPTRAAGKDSSLELSVSCGQPQLLRCLVTAVDGRGRGSIVISAGANGQRRTAAFLCDVERGIFDVMGAVEPESPDAGGLIDEIQSDSGGDGVRDVPELALGLLSVCFALNGPHTPQSLRDWLDGTLGPSFQPSAFPVAIAEWDATAISSDDMPRRVDEVLDRCPTWVDTSPLTFDLAEEILLREGQPAADPDRDAGVYRFLFEHRLINRLELYRRMLFWMAWLWKCADEALLSATAFAVLSQLSDNQYAVPSHPFTGGVTTRSLLSAQRILVESATSPSRRRKTPRTSAG